MRKSYQATSWSSPQWICEEKCLLSWLRYFERVLFLWKVLGQCQQLCFSVRRFLPTELSPSYFPRFPIRPRCRRFHLAPSQRNSPQARSHGFPSVHPVVASASRSLPMELSPSYFPRLPLRPACRRFHLAPSHGALPEASARESLYTEKLLHTEAFTLRKFLHKEAFTQKLLHRNFDTQTRLDSGVLTQGRVYKQKHLCTEAFFAQSSFTQRSLDREACTHKGFQREKTFIQRSLDTEELLHREVLTQRRFTHRYVYKQKVLQIEALSAHRNFFHRAACTHRSFYTKKPLHFTQRSFYTQELLHKEAQEIFYTQKLSHTEAFYTEKSYTEELLRTDAFTQRSLYTEELLHTEAFYAQNLCTK